MSDLDANLRSGPQMLMYRALAKELARRRPGRLLDWGCGWGQVTKLLRDEGVDAVAYDYRPGLAAPTTERLERFPEIEAWLSSELVALPFEAESFDTVRSCGTFYVTNLPNRFSYTERAARLLGLYYHGKLPDDRVYTRRTARELLERHGFTVETARLAHMLPLTLGGPARPIWAVSNALERVPGLNLVATSLELVARSPG